MTTKHYPELSIFVSGDKELRTWYEQRVAEHNAHVTGDPFPNSGFDLAVPSFTKIAPGGDISVRIDFQVICTITDSSSSSTEGFYIYPRSSISKTPLMMANHVGIIDSGYRGNIMAAFRNLATTPFEMEPYTRLVQVCHSTLKPFLIKMVDNEEDMGTTARGTGGFGSTGK